jgi:transposase-like protein
MALFPGPSKGLGKKLAEICNFNLNTMKEELTNESAKEMAKELFGKVRDKKEFNQIVSQLIKHGIETVLKAELDDHLGNEKHQGSVDGNMRN